MSNKPAPAPSGWSIDTSAGREILVYEGCSVIEEEQARQVLAAMTAKAPLPEDVGFLQVIIDGKASGRMSEWPQLVPACRAALRSISDLTRRLAKVEAERNEHRDNATMLQGRCASALAQLATRERECLATMEQLIGERAMLRGRAEAFKARVREMDATIDAMAEAHAHDDQALTAAYLSGALEGKKAAEAFKTRVMEWARGRCECCKNNNPENGACPDDCYPGHITAWTPPQAWEVK